jgi:peptidyl-prolyl cis-trans isomerase SurA
MNAKTSMFLQAAKWSEDPGSKNKGGCYPLQRKGTFVPEYEAAVSNTAEGGFSPVFETEFGFHFVKVIEKRGDFYEACHILMSPKVKVQDLDNTRELMDSVVAEVKAGHLTFAEAAFKFSTDELSKNQEGRVINPETGGSKHDAGQIAPNVFLMLDKLQVGEISEPILIENPDASQSYAVYTLISRTEAHRANLKDDYLIFKDQAEQEVQLVAMEKWISKTIQSTYIQVDDMYMDCVFEHDWIKDRP